MSQSPTADAPESRRRPAAAGPPGTVEPGAAEPDAAEPDDLPEQLRVRREKRQRLLDSGTEPYPVAVDRTHTLRAVREAFGALEPGAATGTTVGVAGRIVFVRNTGKLCFATLQEGDGTRLQAMISLAGVGESALAAWKADVDLGDHVFVHGRGDLLAQRRAVGAGRRLADGRQGAAPAAGAAPASCRRRPGSASATST